MLLLLAVALQSTTAAPPPIPPGCTSPESRQFDFWVGSWEVRQRGTDRIVAHSLIEKKYMGCAIRENWMPLGKELAGGGGSLSHYDPRQGKWRQAWVDSSGARVDFTGGFADGIMTIAGNWPNFSGPGKDAMVRMRYQVLPNGEVRQLGESSTDGGRTWAPSFDFLYRKAELPDFK